MAVTGCIQKVTTDEQPAASLLTGSGEWIPAIWMLQHDPGIRITHEVTNHVLAHFCLQ